ncbi:MAG: HNH endonuclease [Candidatus Micrarchaeota archaeon]
MPTIPQSTRFRIFLRDDNKCANCRKKAEDGAMLTVSNIIPKAAGGTDGINNLMTLCNECSALSVQLKPTFAPLKKHNRIPPEYALGILTQAIKNFRSIHGSHNLSFEEAKIVANDMKYVSGINPLFSPLPTPAIVSAALVLHQEGKIRLDSGLIRI